MASQWVTVGLACDADPGKVVGVQIELRHEDRFFVLACDGVWDVMSKQEVVQFVSVCLDRGMALPDIASQLLDACLAPDPRETRGIGARCSSHHQVSQDGVLRGTACMACRCAGNVRWSRLVVTSCVFIIKCVVTCTLAISHPLTSHWRTWDTCSSVIQILVSNRELQCITQHMVF